MMFAGMFLQPRTHSEIVDIGPTIAEQVELDSFTKVIDSVGVRQGQQVIAVDHLACSVLAL